MVSTWLRQAWRWSWVVTLPVVVVLVVWADATFRRYWSFGVRYDTKPMTTRLSRVGTMEFRHLLRQLQLAVPPIGPRASTDLRTLDLFLPEAEEARLDANLPHSGGEYVEGRLVYDDGRPHKVSVRYRGDFVWHWGYYKKSLRIKTKKKRLYHGLRTFNLIAPKRPELLNSFLGYKLAETLGLLTPYVELVNLRVNGELRGVYLLAEQLKELTLRRHDRMPGDVYAGELIGRDSYRGINNHVFDHPWIWNKMAVNNHMPADERKPLERLLHLITARPSDAVQADLMELLDIQAWGRFTALETLLQSFHYDDTHNWRLYFDPARSVFEPVIWDPLGWLGAWRPPVGGQAQLDIIPSRLHDVLLKNARILSARQQALEWFFGSGADRLFLQEVARAIAAMRIAVEADPNLVIDYRVVTAAQAVAAMTELEATIERTFRSVREAYLGRRGAVRYAASTDDRWIKISIDGRRPLSGLRLAYANRIQDLRGARIRYWRDDGPVSVDVSGAASIRGAELILDVPLLARFVPVQGDGNPLRARSLRIAPAYYELLIEGPAASKRLVALFAGRSGTDTAAERVPDLERQVFANAFAVVEPRPMRTPGIWEGRVRITDVRRIDGDLIIRPGTTVELGPGAAIVIRGQLVAEGEADRPVRFVPATPDQSPWGAVVLHGDGASGSRLRYCEFVGGSGLRGDLFEYSAMLSIHDVEDVALSHCRFRDSRIVDDMVHAVYSSVTFSDCTFQRAFADAVDLDICDAVVDRCTFDENGNDGLDLMGTTAVVRGSLLRANGDKGISVGERSHLFAVNNEMEGNAIGVQVKDGSEAVLYNVDLVNNGKALDAYKKNWQYGSGGRVRLYKAHVKGNLGTFTADAESHVWVYDSYVNGSGGSPEQVTIDETVDRRQPRVARRRRLWRHPDDEATPSMMSRHWTAVRPARRGAFRLAH
jgi:hypothetical protein